MIVIPPIRLGADQLASTNAPDTAAWVASATYAKDGRAVQSGLEYRSLAAGNLGNDPATSPTWWYAMGTVNRLAAFDVSPRSQCLGPPGASLVMQIRPGARCTSIALLNVSAATVAVHIVDEADGDVLHPHTVYPMATSSGTYWSWFFEPLKQQRNLVLSGLEPSTRALITLTFTPLAGQAAVGVVALGRDVYIGDADYGFAPGTQLRGKSYIDRNDNPVRPERGRARTLSGTVIVGRQDYNRVNQFLDEIIGVPCIWVLDESSGDYISATTYGDFERIAARIDNYATSSLSLDINGYQ